MTKTNKTIDDVIAEQLAANSNPLDFSEAKDLLGEILKATKVGSSDQDKLQLIENAINSKIESGND